MECEDLRDLLDLYLDGELPEETMRKLDRHLMRCANCAYQVRTLEQTRAMLCDAVPREETTSSFRDRAMARLLDHFGPELRPARSPQSERQWVLPFNDIRSQEETG